MAKNSLAVKFDTPEIINRIDKAKGQLKEVGQEAKKTESSQGAATAKPWQFQKGQSGNPGGRQPIPDDIKAMLKAAVPDAFNLLINTVKDEKVKRDLRLKAADSLLDRVYGKATQPIDGNITGVSIPQAVADLSIDELKKLIESAKK